MEKIKTMSRIKHNNNNKKIHVYENEQWTYIDDNKQKPILLP